MTDFVNSQTLAELWGADVPCVERISWVATETWVRRLPATGEIVSALHAEPWSANTTVFVVSQAFAEVWAPVGGVTPPPTWRRLPLSSQAP
jgi:hypothetical protein